MSGRVFAKEEVGGFCGFYPSEVYEVIPKGAVEITEKLHLELRDGEAAGKRIAWVKGLPVLVDAPPASKEIIDAQRARAYSDPAYGSDRFLAEAASERLRGNEDKAAAAEQNHLARRAEIAEQFPWP